MATLPELPELVCDRIIEEYLEAFDHISIHTLRLLATQPIPNQGTHTNIWNRFSRPQNPLYRSQFRAKVRQEWYSELAQANADRIPILMAPPATDLITDCVQNCFPCFKWFWSLRLIPPRGYNRNGLGYLEIAIRAGQLPTVQWLIEHLPVTDLLTQQLEVGLPDTAVKGALSHGEYWDIFWQRITTATPTITDLSRYVWLDKPFEPLYSWVTVKVADELLARNLNIARKCGGASTGWKDVISGGNPNALAIFQWFLDHPGGSHDTADSTSPLGSPLPWHTAILLDDYPSSKWLSQRADPTTLCVPPDSHFTYNIGELITRRRLWPTSEWMLEAWFKALKRQNPLSMKHHRELYRWIMSLGLQKHQDHEMPPIPPVQCGLSPAQARKWRREYSRALEFEIHGFARMMVRYAPSSWWGSFYHRLALHNLKHCFRTTRTLHAILERDPHSTRIFQPLCGLQRRA
ncbi:hypothetical protein NUU61_001601 [Penicillium alfredii]|uniref:Uncharacterized protein n=1 Tax=Penicillium alfredii TaxID=1506179 RepID=A0A9W9G1E3_9EURO|nr:uncharacterized protein NUU61_001601 [Penicillium alfredii]KAJ5110344.1 hypothetical protein NUU61_001601 [Penicillium alfredii]